MDNQFTRKVGLFGSTVALATNTVKGLDTALNDTIVATTAVTGGVATVATIGSSAINIWGESTLRSMTRQAEIDDILEEAEIAQHRAQIARLKSNMDES